MGLVGDQSNGLETNRYLYIEQMITLSYDRVII